MRQILLLAMLLSVKGLYSQSNNWEIVYQSSALNIYSNYTECHDVANGIHKEKVLLKFENLTNQDLELSYSREMWYDDRCLGCEENASEYTYTINLSPYESKAGDCATKDKTWYIFSKFLNRKTAELSRFEIKDVNIKNIEE